MQVKSNAQPVPLSYGTTASVTKANMQTSVRLFYLQSATPALLQNGLYQNVAVVRVDVG